MSNNPPDDWENPNWNIKQRVCNWKKYATDELQSEWTNFTERQKKIISALLDDIAMDEEWGE